MTKKQRALNAMAAMAVRGELDNHDIPHDLVDCYNICSDAKYRAESWLVKCFKNCVNSKLDSVDHGDIDIKRYVLSHNCFFFTYFQVVSFTIKGRDGLYVAYVYDTKSNTITGYLKLDNESLIITDIYKSFEEMLNK